MLKKLFSREPVEAAVPSGPEAYFGLMARGPAFGQDVESWAQAYQAADPFPHIVLDDLFEPATLRRVTAEIPSPLASTSLFTADVKHLQERKFAWRDVPALGPESTRLIAFLNGKPFLEFLSALTGIPGLVPDPYMWGAGFHQILRGGKLAIHADFNIHPVTQLYRRVNLLLYLNEGWEADWGGDLELWNASMDACVQKVSPLFNRTVIFSTTDVSFHGHPEPMTCPEDKVRRSLALYYYTYERLPHDPHSTLWRDRPDDGGVVQAAMDDFWKKA
ncbi:2OG-Fe(II) oxygenase [Phenylobacterium sp.]|uniref:2OG-Fe(II) oxygenase n=1 Tax=Phenylobacterium sp. TaxID=1871053 RepID=UPI0028118DB9|nr:2OG-Fe(II) oxygenase [Phenylobacterium sp.]